MKKNVGKREKGRREVASLEKTGQQAPDGNQMENDRRGKLLL